MTKRTPVSAQQNIWFDAQEVDNTDLTLEQNYNDTINCLWVEELYLIDRLSGNYSEFPHRCKPLIHQVES